MEEPNIPTYYILPGEDSTISNYIDKTNALETIGIFKAPFSRTEIAEKINLQFSGDSKNNDGLLHFCKDKITAKFILKYISPETITDEEGSVFSFNTESSSSAEILPPSYSDTILYAYDAENEKILSFVIFSLDRMSNMTLYIICSPYHFGTPTMEKVLEYSNFMNLKYIYLKAIGDIVSSFYKKFGFIENTIHFSEEQIKSYKKYKNEVNLILDMENYTPRGAAISFGGIKTAKKRRRSRRHCRHARTIKSRD